MHRSKNIVLHMQVPVRVDRLSQHDKRYTFARPGRLPPCDKHSRGLAAPCESPVGATGPLRQNAMARTYFLQLLLTPHAPNIDCGIWSTCPVFVLFFFFRFHATFKLLLHSLKEKLAQLMAKLFFSVRHVCRHGRLLSHTHP